MVLALLCFDVVSGPNATKAILEYIIIIPDSKVHGANMGPTWVLSDPDGPHVGPMSLAIRDIAFIYTELVMQPWQHKTIKLLVYLKGHSTQIQSHLFRQMAVGASQLMGN